MTTLDPKIHDVNLHIKPGRKRAPFFRYIRINLPKTTRVLLVAVVATIGGCAGWTSTSARDIFSGSDIALWLIAGLAAVFVALGVTRLRVWDFGLVPAIGALIVYGIGLASDAPYVWNGASVLQAAVWNLMMLCALAYLVLYWALGYGMIVAYPDDQGFED
ncbi:hypothetical protein [Corynebacterium sp. H130]|uniref:hypothetical protein n=1 Tax=Corynebacterium sp. H130 TaxID=3133444 RepID=UPI0030A89625